MSLDALVTYCLGARDAVSFGRKQFTQWAAWLLPISADSSVGEDAGYDEDFQLIREEVNKLSGADADLVIQLAEKLLTQTSKDLRVATYYLWARLHKEGEVGLADGLSLLAALIEHFPDVRPARGNSRKITLEWLASSKVLDSLSLYPEVVKAEAEGTVAALAWLEQALKAWPESQRPELGTLYAALSTRLTRSGGIEAVVPQNGARPDSNAPASATPVTSPKSGRDLLDGGRALAGYLREQPQGWLAAHRLMKSLRWDTIHQTPPQDANGTTRLVAPRGEYRAQLKRLYLQQNWTELLDQVERMYAEGVNHFWLDLQWYLCEALSKQPAPEGSWADIVKRDLGMFLDRLPGVEELYWSDGTAFADETTRAWITQHVSGNRPEQWLPATTAAPASIDTDILSLESEALAQADSDGIDAALAWLAARPEVETGRQRWLLRLLMARVAEQYGKSELAIHLLGELEATAQRQALADWEPELNFEVKARLLKLLRVKAQRGDADKPSLARRMEALLAVLVAIDPVRASVLCA
ncbi:type VI secretion system protein TssA [Pseudomonas folii]|uniref:Type VI secretion system protein TssA n=1 Tax=Pseudomonas folii TaxID=2762593 RepID=A0ABR7AUT1_9PSED|nr:type VI secretion system protein TssA [Pseudomonas folii]MBC3948667.1 type VI secretion system protein TssA [Pseudomonas folii]